MTNDLTAHDIRIVAINGSAQPNNNTGKALAVAADELRKQPGVTLEVFEPINARLPLPGVAGSEGDMEDLERLAVSVNNATGVLLSTPEYHGSYSSVIKLIIDNLGYPSVLGGKPIALLGVAAGQIGAVKALEHLRSVCSHIGAIVLPGPVSVAGVHKVFDESGRCLDESVEKRIRRGAKGLIEYIHNHICPKMTLEEMVRNETA